MSVTKSLHQDQIFLMDEHLRFCKRTYKNPRQQPNFRDSDQCDETPMGPKDGDWWWDYEEGIAFIFFEDHAQWMQVTGPGPNAEV